jgi:hypothetical protein
MMINKEKKKPTKFKDSIASVDARTDPPMANPNMMAPVEEDPPVDENLDPSEYVRNPNYDASGYFDNVKRQLSQEPAEFGMVKPVEPDIGLGMAKPIDPIPDDIPMQTDTCGECNMGISADEEQNEQVVQSIMCCCKNFHKRCLEEVIKEQYLEDQKVLCPSCKCEFGQDFYQFIYPGLIESLND